MMLAFAEMAELHHALERLGVAADSPLLTKCHAAMATKIGQLDGDKLAELTLELQAEGDAHPYTCIHTQWYLIWIEPTLELQAGPERMGAARALVAEATERMYAQLRATIDGATDEKLVLALMRRKVPTPHPA